MSPDRSTKTIARIILILVVVLLPIATPRVTSLALSAGIFIPFVAHEWPRDIQDTAEILITEILYAPTSPEPAGEWIEIYNPKSTTLNLDGYKIGDAESQDDREGMFCFPANQAIEPAQVVIIANQTSAFFGDQGFKSDFEFVDTDPEIPNMVKCTGWASGSVNLSNSGDEVIILNGADEIVDVASWGSSTIAFTPAIPGVAEGHSVERRPANQDNNAASDWINQPRPDPGRVDLSSPTPSVSPTPSASITPSVGISDTPIICEQMDVLISEVFYDPAGVEEPAGEWLEVFNSGSYTANLPCIKVGDEEIRGGGEGMLAFPAGGMVAPGEVLVVANNAMTFNLAYGFDPDYEMVDSNPLIPDMIKYSDWSNGSVSLNNTGDDVLLLDGNDNLMDAVSWGSSTFAFDPPVKAVPEGYSLERQPGNQDSDSAADWIEQATPNPGEVILQLNTHTPTIDLSPTNITTGASSATVTSTKTRTPTVTKTKTPTKTPTSTPIPCGAVQLLVSEVMVDPPGGGDPEGEWIEIYNAGSTTVNLPCVKAGDEEATGGGEGMLSFPLESRMQPGDIVIIAYTATSFRAVYGFAPDFEVINSDPVVPDMLKYNPWATGSFNLANPGDEVLILDYLDRLVDAVSWGSSTFAFYPSIPVVAAGHSVERRPTDHDGDSAVDWIDQSVPSPGKVDFLPPTATPSPTSTHTPTTTATTPPEGWRVYISEVLYYPLDNVVDKEWIEIYNASAEIVDLSDFKVGDEETASGIESMYRFPLGSLVNPGEAIIIANKASTFLAVYGIQPDYELHNSDESIVDMIKYVTWSTGDANLSNNGDEVLILDGNDQIIDLVAYGNSTYPDFQPPVSAVLAGHSIERVPADSDTDSFLDWIDQDTPTPGHVSLTP